MKLAIITALHQRYKLTGLFLGYYEALRIKGFNIGLFCSVTQGDGLMKEIVSAFPAWTPTPSVNRPLSDKFNASMPAVRDFDPDAMLLVGSDDFVNKKYITWTADALSGGHLVVPKQVYFYDTATNRLMWGMYTRAGAGRMFSRECLKMCDYRPWPDQWDALDGGQDKRLSVENGYEWVRPDDTDSFGGVILDVKTQENIWSFDHMLKRSHGFREPAPFLKKHFPSISGTLLNWHDDAVHSDKDVQ